VLRSLAFGWLARPAELLTLLLEHTEPAEPAEPAESADVPGEDVPDPVPARAWAFPVDLLDALRAVDPERLRPRVVLYLHLHEAALTNAAGVGAVARVEGLGPHGLSQLTDLVGHARVSITPVIDLRDRISVNAYEHPVRIVERVHLERPGDAFPHASSMSRRLDLDHRLAYRAQGPPGQTGTDNCQPLGRTGHRAKTHLAYRSAPVATGETLWRTPHGLHRLVDHTGTHHLDADEAAALSGDDPVQRALVRLVIRHRTGALRSR
jgi:hypothetical protein